MPCTEDMTVHFTTTLFALIRESLSIKMGPAEDMDKNDEELRDTIRKLWPIQAKKMLDLLIPPNSGMQQGLSIPSVVRLVAKCGFGREVLFSKKWTVLWERPRCEAN